MTAANLEIIEMYDNCDMSVEEIVSETGYESAAIKNILLTGSKKYKKASKSDKAAEQITSAEDQRLVEGIKNLAFYAENEAVRLRALMYAHDERHGRNDKQKPTGFNVNILMLNKALKQVAESTDNCNSIIDVDDMKQLAGGCAS